MAEIFNKVVSIILALIVLVGLLTGFGLFKAPVTFLAEKIAEVVQPWGTATPFTETGRDEAYDSVQALMYSINRVAWWDTYEGNNLEVYKTFEKNFNRVKVVPTIHDSDAISFSTDPKDVTLHAIAYKMKDCRMMFLDKGKENTHCANLDFKDYTGSQITKDEILDAIEIEKAKCTTKDCTNLFKELKKNKIELKSELKKPRETTMCIKKHGLSFRLIFTENINECTLPENDLKFKYGIKVQEFILPQEIKRIDGSASLGSAIAYTIEEWLDVHGDPKYIMYYEHFPEGEDQYWHPAAYKVDYLTILAVEGAFMLLDFIPLGKLIKKIPIVGPFIESVQKMISDVVSRPGSIINVMKEFVDEKLPRMLKGVAPEFFEAMIAKLNRNNKFFISLLTQELTFEAGEKTIKELTSEFAEQYGSRELGEDLVQTLIEKTQTEFIPEVVEEFGERTISESGTRLSQEASQELQEKIIKEIQEMGLEVSDEMTEKIAKGLDTTLDIDDYMKISRRGKLAAESNEYLEKIFKKINDGDYDALVKAYSDMGWLDTMKPEEFAKYQKTIGKSIDASLELQYKNLQLLESMGVDPDTFVKLSRVEKEAVLDNAMEKFFEKAGMDNSQFKSKRFWSAVKGYTTKKRHLVTAMAVILNDRLLSINEKFTPVGTNAIGVRTPFLATSVYDDTYTKYWDWEDDEDKKEYENFFNYYAGYGDEGITEEQGTRYRGLLKEVGRYYISLQKDPKTFWSGQQPNDRFHLVSPCKADVYVRVTQCECYGKPKTSKEGIDVPIIGNMFARQGVYETGARNPELDGQTISNFDGKNKMLYTIGENGVIVKECDPPGAWKEAWGVEAQYKPMCVVVNPVLDTEYPDNYCYHGKTPDWLVAADITLNYVGPIAASLAAAGTTGLVCGTVAAPATAGVGALIGAPACGTIFGGLVGGAAGMIGGVVYANLALNEAWPNHVNPGGKV